MSWEETKAWLVEGRGVREHNIATVASRDRERVLQDAARREQDGRAPGMALHEAVSAYHAAKHDRPTGSQPGNCYRR